MSVLNDIQKSVAVALKDQFQHEIAENQINIQSTKKEFDGDFTLVTFAFTKALRKKPEEIGESLGSFLVENDPHISAFNVVKGFLNLSLSDAYWLGFLERLKTDTQLLEFDRNDKKVLVEFSSPNTNKPLHLGHIRNILLGWSISQILEYSGAEVIKTQIVNDRGIAVCKSMYAWLKTSEGATPESSGTKGDHFVGHYYVQFEKMFQEEYKRWLQSEAGQSAFSSSDKPDLDIFAKTYKNEYFNEHSTIGKETKEMLLRWEAGDEATLDLWKKMNQWVYDGFDITYDMMGVSFDSMYYESDTYLVGKKLVESGLSDKLFFQKEDKSIWADLEADGMDQKILLRSDGTSVYMTQDLGTAQLRYKDHQMNSMVYVVGNEQEYHFKVLFKLLEKIGEPYAANLKHLSYGMVDLPNGKMKSREGTVVDADDLMKEVIAEAKNSALERGELTEKTDEEKAELYRKIGMAALKFFIVRVNPKKGMTFDPKESVDMQGQTGPYIQNAFVRIQSILRRTDQSVALSSEGYEIQPQEKLLLREICFFKHTIQDAADGLDPSHVANYCYNLAKNFHKFYHDHRILGAESDAAKAFRIELSAAVADVLKRGMNLLGIEMPDFM